MLTTIPTLIPIIYDINTDAHEKEKGMEPKPNILPETTVFAKGIIT